MSAASPFPYPSRPRSRPRRRVAPLHLPPLVLLLLAWGCGGSPPVPVVEPPGDEYGVYCPLPLVFEEGDVRPVRLRLENRTSRSLVVFVDRCYHHTRLADVPPGRTRQPRLPDPLVAFPEGLRFHAFDRDTGDFYGVFTVPVEAEGVLRLVLDDERRADPGSLIPFRLSDDQEEEMRGTYAIGSTDSGGWAAIWADPSTAILTWSCTDGRPGVTLAAPGRLSGDAIHVRVRRDEGPWQSLGAWSVQRGLQEALVVPEERYGQLRELFGGTGTVDLMTDAQPTAASGAPSAAADSAGADDEARRERARRETRSAGRRTEEPLRRVHRFRTEALEDALGTLGCWGVPPTGAAEVSAP